MNQTNVKIPDELKELPIMQFAGTMVPDQLKTPEAKKTISRILFWGGSITLVAWFIHALPTLMVTLDNIIGFGVKGIIVGVLAIAALVLYKVYPKIVSFLDELVTLKIFQARKRSVEENPIDSLELLEEEIETTYKQVDGKINEIDGVRDSFVSDASDLEDGAQKKYQRIEGIYTNMTNLEKDAEKLLGEGFGQQSRDKKRQASECQQTASLLKSEADADKETAEMYVQYANEFGKVIEVLKDNRLAAKMYLNATKSTIKIISRKLDATSRMKEASEGIAAAFNIKDSWIFQVAIQSAKSSISQNVATMRNNLQFLSQNSAMVSDSKAANRLELDNFIEQMKKGSIKRLNVSEMVDPSYQLSDAERVDKGFKILQ